MWEAVIVDDFSTDSTFAVINECIADDERISLIQTKQNSGPSIARNLGIDALSDSCKWLTFVDSDDFIMDNYLEKMIDYSKEYQADCVWVNHWDISEKSTVQQYDIVNKGVPIWLDTKLASGREWLLNERVRNLITLSWGKLYKRSLWSDVRFSERFRIYEDGATLYKVLYKCERMVYVNEPLVCYRLSEGSLIRSPQSIDRLQCAVDGYVERVKYFKEKRIML